MTMQAIVQRKLGDPNSLLTRRFWEVALATVGRISYPDPTAQAQLERSVV